MEVRRQHVVRATGTLVAAHVLEKHAVVMKVLTLAGIVLAVGTLVSMWMFLVVVRDMEIHAQRRMDDDTQ